VNLSVREGYSGFTQISRFLPLQEKAREEPMKLKRSRRHIFKRTRIRTLIVWYLVLLGGIIILVWKMPAIVSRL
jgi:cell division septal protein FtsQ